MGNWQPDILGAGYEALEFDLGQDSEGPLVATLVRSLASPAKILDRMRNRKRLLEDVDVLYLHGWSDYFFQTQQAEFWTSRGANFYALDLRKYGRSLRPGQTPGYIEDLAHYDDEIALALDEMGTKARGRRLFMLGHSTGGLVLSLWVARHPHRVDALLLNSPWLELQVAGALRHALITLVDLSARYRAIEGTLPQIDFGFYHRAQVEVAPKKNPLSVNEAWRPEKAPPVRSGWLKAVIDGHSRVAEGLHITTPVYVMLSARFQAPVRWSEALTNADTVINVDEIARASMHLGSTVTVERIEGALHDIFLSRWAVRQYAYDRMERWLTGVQAADTR